MILAIETSASVCSVALCSENETIKEYTSDSPMQHASLLGKYVQDILMEINGGLKLVAVAIGPGSFTGLRIGLSYAQGLCFGRKIPIVGVSNYQVLASQIKDPKGDIFSIIDAHRDEFYLAKHTNSKIFEIEYHKIIASKELFNETGQHSSISCNNSLILPENMKDAGNVNRVSYNASLIASLGKVIFNSRGGDNIEKLEPMYIRPFAGLQ